MQLFRQQDYKDTGSATDQQCLQVSLHSVFFLNPNTAGPTRADQQPTTVCSGDKVIKLFNFCSWYSKQISYTVFICDESFLQSVIFQGREAYPYFKAGMIELRDSQLIWNDMSPFQYHLSYF